MNKIIDHTAGFIVSIATIVLLILVVFRIAIVGELPSEITWQVFYYLSAAVNDFIFFLGLGLFFFMFVVFKKWISRYFNRWIKYFYFLFLILFLIISFFNISIVKNLGNPLNYQWLYYSDFLKSADAKSAIMANFGWEEIKNILLVLLIISVALFLSVRFGDWLKSKFKSRNLIFFFLFFSSSYIFLSIKIINIYNIEEGKVANPVIFFIKSLNWSEGLVFGKVDGKSDKIVFISDHKEGTTDYVEKPDYNKIKNVILFVMESIPAKYLEVYNSNFATSPILKEYKSQSLIFTNAYAHTPATNKSLFSLLASVQSWLTYKSLVREYPEVGFPTLNKILKKEGFTTAYFNSGMKDEVEEFIKNQNFDIEKDFTNINCNTTFTDSTNINYLNEGVDEICTVNSLIEWINKVKHGPFFSLVWTFQTHYPYFYSGKEESFNVQDDNLNRYLNGVKRTDKALGNLLKYLNEANLSDSTLVIVTADHGEAFGEHGVYGHAARVYEENIHIPLILIHKGLFKGEEINAVCGLKDIAPTLLNLLKVKVPEQWQGNDLLSDKRPVREFFTAPYSDFLVGYKEGHYKYILNTKKNSLEIFDLKADPLERINLVSKFPEEKEIAIKRINGWMQYQDSFMKDNLGAK